MSNHNLHSAVHSLDHASKHSGTDGALAGAVGVAAAVATGAAVVGYALTPLGWVTMAAIGATGGGTGAFKKLREKLKNL